MSEDGRWDIPQTWTWTKAEDFSVVIGGGTPHNAKDDSNYAPDGTPWITPADLSEYEGVYIERGRRDLSEKGFKSSSARLMPKGTVLLSSRAPVGYCAIASGPISTNQGFKSFVLDDPSLLPEYIRYYLLASKQYLESEASGTTFLELSGGRAKELLFPIAPSNEQERIVSRIDELFSSIDEGERALQRVRKLVERYRQSVLKAAVTGELTREWREQNAAESESGEALLTRILEARRKAWETTQLKKMTARGQRPSDDSWKAKYEEPLLPDGCESARMPEGWALVSFNHIAECLDYARRPINRKSRSGRLGSVPYYGANGQVGTIDEYLFDETLILVVEDETFTGRTQPFSYKIAGKSWVNNHAHVLRATSETHVDFLNAILMRYPFIPLTKGTTARRKLTQKSLLGAPVAVPSLREQNQIIHCFDAALISLIPVEKEVERAAKVLASLRQVILREAFRGKLLSQDPADESATALLDRISAERATAASEIATAKGKKSKSRPSARITNTRKGRTKA